LNRLTEIFSQSENQLLTVLKKITKNVLKKNPIETFGRWLLCRQTKLNPMQKVKPKAGHLAKASNL